MTWALALLSFLTRPHCPSPLRDGASHSLQMGTFPSAHPRDPGAAWLSALSGEGGLGGQQNSTLMLKPGPGRGPGHQPARLAAEAPTAAPASLLLWATLPAEIGRAHV